MPPSRAVGGGLAGKMMCLAVVWPPGLCKSLPQGRRTLVKSKLLERVEERREVGCSSGSKARYTAPQTACLGTVCAAAVRFCTSHTLPANQILFASPLCCFLVPRPTNSFLWCLRVCGRSLAFRLGLIAPHPLFLYPCHSVHKEGVGRGGEVGCWRYQNMRCAGCLPRERSCDCCLDSYRNMVACFHFNFICLCCRIPGLALVTLPRHSPPYAIPFHAL